jgi:opacity protein-like surface antigen
MRKLLLGSVAALGFAGSAYAAGLVEINQTTTPPLTGDAGGVINPPVMTAWNAPKANPDPGKVIVHFDGLFAVDFGVNQSNTNHGEAGTANQDAKADPYAMGGVFRLYLGFDGKLMNGVIYGGNAEMRTNFAGANNAPGNYSVTGSIGNGSSNSTASTWYTRRAYTYIGSPTVGLFRFGQGEGVTSLFTQPSITTGEAYDTGQWDGDAGDIVPGNASLAWTFNDVGNEYDPMKVTYLSPTIAGFVFAVDFAPDSAALSPGSSNNAAQGALSAQSSSTLASDWARPRNTFEAGIRYSGPVGPLTVEGSVAYQKSGVVGNAQLVQSLTGGPIHYKGVDAIDTGLGITFMGASVFGHLYTGTMNGTMTPQAEIPGRAEHGLSYVGGVMYNNGPWTVGTSLYTFQSMGAAGATGEGATSAAIPVGFPGAGTTVKLGNRKEIGFDVGGTFNLAPGCNLFADYIIGWRHQAGVNFVDPLGPANQENHTYVAAFLLSTVFLW